MSDTQGPYMVVEQGKKNVTFIVATGNPLETVDSFSDRDTAEIVCSLLNAAYTRGAAAGWDKGVEAGTVYGENIDPSGCPKKREPINPYRSLPLVPGQGGGTGGDLGHSGENPQGTDG